jgi:hypothetical protein
MRIYRWLLLLQERAGWQGWHSPARQVRPQAGEGTQPLAAASKSCGMCLHLFTAGIVNAMRVACRFN